jgi:hypothetical protein
MLNFYTYIWVREDGTPWYIGKGSGKRAWQRCKGHWAPKDPSLIFVQYWPDEETAFAFEIYLIDFWGRIDLGTGCLRNRTDGGENPPVTFSKPWLKGRPAWNRGKTGLGGYKWSEESKNNLSKAMFGNKRGLGIPCSEEKKEKIRQALIGHEVPGETRNKISKTLSDRTFSEERKEKLRGPRGPQKNPHRRA